MYGALTKYLGFDMLDGEFKVMGMAPYGEPMVCSPEDALNMFYGSDHGRCAGYQVKFLSVYFPERTSAAGASVT